MRGLLVELARYNSASNEKITSLAIPSFCTGVGGMGEKESATQMRVAFENVALNGWKNIKHPAMAPYAKN